MNPQLPPQRQRKPPNNGNLPPQSYIPIDPDESSLGIWKLLILGAIGWVFLSSLWVFSEMPGDILIGGSSSWSSDQTWYAAAHFGALLLAALLVYLNKR